MRLKLIEQAMNVLEKSRWSDYLDASLTTWMASLTASLPSRAVHGGNPGGTQGTNSGADMGATPEESSASSVVPPLPPLRCR
jgi:hypothetical protein